MLGFGRMMFVVFREKTSFFNILFLGLLFYGGSVFAEDRAGATSANDLPDKATAKLIKELGSVNWRIRERATQVMMNRGPELYEPLRNALRIAPGHEVRVRIKRIIREIYIAEMVGPGSAFLGIQHTGRSEYSHSFPRIPAGSSGILVDRVFPSTAADRAGLMAGDLILSLNGERATGKRSALDFTGWIGSQKVGAVCRLGILRGGKGMHLNQDDNPDFDPRSFSKLETSIVRNEDDPRVPKGGVALRVEAKPAGTGASNKLARGDLLIALDGVPISPEDAADVFSKWTRGEPIAEALVGPQLDQVQGMFQIQGNRRLPNGRDLDPGKGNPSVQVLKGGQWIEFDVVLGRRPDYLPDWQTRRGAARAKSINEAVASFETWWDEWLRSGEIVTDHFDAEAYWRLEP